MGPGRRTTKFPIAGVLVAAALLAFVGLNGGRTASAQDGAAAVDDAKPEEPLPIEMETRLEPHEVYPGDEIRLIVTFRSEKPFSADVVGGLPLGDFDLKERDMQRSEEDGKQVVRHVFTLVQFKAGTFELPKVPFSLKQGSRQEERSSDLVRVAVKSLLEEEGQKIALQQARDQAAKQGAAQPGAGGPGKVVQPGQNQPVGPTFNLPQGQAPAPGSPMVQPGQPPAAPGGPQPMQVELKPRDIKGPAPLIREDYTLLYVAGGAAAAAFLGAGIWFYLRRRKPRPIIVERIVDTRPPDVIALARLAQLEAEQLVAKRKLKDYHTRLAEILHDYFGRRYNLVDALAMTSEELILALGRLYLRDLDERVVGEVLFACDLVKFAKLEPDDASSLERLGKAKLIVERTKEERGGVQ
ncbi:MAG: hypothetical protein C4523_19800 [Myxococcales bacterium]|nr:MAG: hypothetical protein C4523_19800 [Myxococcales bacterium]